MAFITTNYSNNQHITNGPLPEGDYEFIINGVQEHASKSGNTAINFDLIVRNDLDQALPETNGKQQIATFSLTNGPVEKRNNTTTTT